jgi:formylglycine-generating enzyme required for sulfatase activity
MFASCQTGGNPLTCPAASSISCCASPEVTPNGAFYRTYANSGGGPTGEADPATVSGFRLDQYLVTVARFRRFVSAWNGGSGWKPPPGSGSHPHAHAGLGLANSASAGSYETGWVAADDSNVAPTNTNLLCDSAFETWTASAGNYDAMPINCVNWYEAYAFCIWDGGFLPSEAEWEYAAAGGSLQRQYPWGSTAPGSSSFYAISGCVYQGGGVCEGVQNIAPVGTAAEGVGLWGQYDLAGNVFEWNLDWYSAYADPCTDCAYLTPTGDRVTRGGDYSSSPSGLLPPNRTTALPTTRAGNIGFRCARTP